MKNRIARIALYIVSLTPLFAAHAEDPKSNAALVEETVKLARSYLGESDTLDAVTSIQYQGVLVYGNGDSGTLASVYKKPLYQKFTSVINDFKEVSALNRTEAWRKVESVSKPGAWSLEFYEVDDIHHMQAAVREALAFLGTPRSRKGHIEYLGTESVEGHDTRILVYYHTDEIWFRRYIDIETGKVISTINDRGVIFEEHGEKMISGIRFPEKMVTRFLTEQGEQTIELNYTSITVNEEIDDTLFGVPIMAD